MHVTCLSVPDARVRLVHVERGRPHHAARDHRHRCAADGASDADRSRRCFVSLQSSRYRSSRQSVRSGAPAVPQISRESNRHLGTAPVSRRQLGRHEQWTAGQRAPSVASTVFVLRDRFIEGRTTSTYPPQEKNPKGEVHEDIAFISLRPEQQDVQNAAVPRRRLRYRICGDSRPAHPRSSSAAKASRIYRAVGARAKRGASLATTSFVELFELAEPGKDFTVVLGDAPDATALILARSRASECAMAPECDRCREFQRLLHGN